jgi:hypothetical protein
MPRARFVLSDVTTTPESPPQFRALEREMANLGRDMTYHPASPTERTGHRKSALAPLACDHPAEQVFELVQAAALEMPRWEVAAVEAARLQVEAIVSSRFPFLFKSDVVVQVRADGADRCWVHVRAKARRSGEWRSGAAELRRIRAFLRRLRAKLG